jgi:hypothetical protein
MINLRDKKTDAKRSKGIKLWNCLRSKKFRNSIPALGDFDEIETIERILNNLIILYFIFPVFNSTKNYCIYVQKQTKISLLTLKTVAASEFPSFLFGNKADAWPAVFLNGWEVLDALKIGYVVFSLLFSSFITDLIGLIDVIKALDFEIDSIGFSLKWKGKA